MNLVKTLCFAPAVVLAMTTSALAQAIEPGLPPRHTLSGIGGAALNADFQEPTTALAVEYGERLHRNVVAFANLSYIQNLMSDQMRQNLVSAGEILTTGTGQLWEFRGHDRGLAFTAGAKYLFPTGSTLRPYVGGGFGVLNLNRTIRERDLGDVTGEFFLLTSLPGDGIIAATETYTTDPLAEAIAGVSGAFGRTFLDVSYRYRWGFHEYGPIEFSQLTIGVGVAWH